MKNHKTKSRGSIKLLFLKQKLLIVALALLPLQLVAQQGRNFNISGTVYEQVDRAKKQPMPFVTVAIKDYSKSSSTDSEGNFLITRVPRGKVMLSIRFIGKVDIDTVININSDMHFDFLMLDENFKLDEVVVTAANTRSDQATSSKISRNAIDHIQATSLTDVMSLLPGGLTAQKMDQAFNNPTQLNLRNTLANGGNEKGEMGGFGSAVIVDGSPISNNANMQAMSPAVAGATTGLGGESQPFGGVDMRSIPTDNIESIEIIRGIPSVQYGDLTSGAIIVNSKAGREPLRINVKSNPTTYQASGNTGFELGGKNGALNVSGDYAHSYKNITNPYKTYQRGEVKVIYSNKFFDNLLTTNTFLSGSYSADKQKQNPDDVRNRSFSDGNSANGTLNTNGIFHINKGILSNINYAASASYTDRKSFSSNLYANADAPYSGSLADGEILSNIAGQDVYDKNGNILTNIIDRDRYALMLPSEYEGRYDIHGKEINLYGKLTSTFFKQLGVTSHTILVGSELRIDGNKGPGKVFTSNMPPYRNLEALNASFRERSYNDIPFMNQLGLFVQDNFSWTIGRRKLAIVAGARYDKITNMKGVLAPRVNASFEVLPNTLTLRGGYGVTTKAPGLMFLFPEKAYFEYVNINETNVSGKEDLIITTTKVYDTQNPELELAQNAKMELGFDLKLGQVSLYATAFKEKLNNGYSTSATVNTFKPFTWVEYKREGNDVVIKDSNPVLSKYYTPTNGFSSNSKGVEFDVDFGRFKSIRTAFSLNGAWIISQNYSTDYTVYDKRNSLAAAGRQHVALYEGGMEKQTKERVSSALRITHNIPEVGFVVTLKTQIIWTEASWKSFGNDSTPVKYISKVDGKVYDFPKHLTPTTIKELSPNDPERQEFELLFREVNRNDTKVARYNPAVTFDVNVTKEIGSFMRVSFFAVNMFNGYPRTESAQEPGKYLPKHVPNFFFGLELSLTL